MTTTTKRHQFTLILRGISEIGDALEDRVSEAGCDDALLWSRDGVVGLHFVRGGENLGEAVGSAIAAVERAGYKVARVEIEDAASVA